MSRSTVLTGRGGAGRTARRRQAAQRCLQRQDPRSRGSYSIAVIISHSYYVSTKLMRGSLVQIWVRAHFFFTPRWKSSRHDWACHRPRCAVWHAVAKMTLPSHGTSSCAGMRQTMHCRRCVSRYCSYTYTHERRRPRRHGRRYGIPRAMRSCDCQVYVGVSEFGTGCSWRRRASQMYGGLCW